MAGNESESFTSLIKKGNKSSLIASIGNSLLAIAKFFAGTISGSGALFASAMHSTADAINQGFVYIGSILSEKRPTPRFPTGFGRVINIFCMVAVIVVTVMAYETIREGWHLIQQPAEAGDGFWINVGVLVLNLIIDGAILVKAMKEINIESRAEAKGIAIVTGAFKNVGRAAPPTRLVFYEDLVAVSGAALALIAVIVISLTNFVLIDGIVTILIGLLMVGVAFRVGYDNMVGLIGVAAPKDIEERITGIILNDKDVTDINKIRILQEGRYYHVEARVELREGLSLAEADDIKMRVREDVLKDPDIADAGIGIIEDDGDIDWESKNQNS
ncbi:cation diffusion facilitator family transporter [Virgibacillus indicus]|uniref:cation diffusion facilitator family transporter n=1 Tax=Virgibacillus indicus TaxID=2024554 RepID=UPI0026B7E466